MSLKYTCLGCGTPLGYEGLCWKCECEKSRKTALGWMPEQIAEKQKNLIQNIQRLADMEDPEFTDFWQLLGYRDAITPEIQRAALAVEGFYPCELYYGAPDDVRDALITALLETDSSQNAAELMSCLAFQGDDKAMETLLELERNPGPGARVSMWIRPAMPSAEAGPLIRMAIGRSSTSIPAILWSRGRPAKRLPFALDGHGRTPVPTVAGIWWICWCLMGGMSG